MKTKLLRKVREGISIVKFKDDFAPIAGPNQTRLPYVVFRNEFNHTTERWTNAPVASFRTLPDALEEIHFMMKNSLIDRGYTSRLEINRKRRIANSKIERIIKFGK
jgi:hypothetical protein